MDTIPTWLYAANGEARIFDLMPGEEFPVGWLDSPGAWESVEVAPAGPDPEITPDPAPEPEPAPAPEPELEVVVAPEPEKPAADFSDEYLAEIIKAEDKVALGQFAAEKGIKLDRRKAFAGMLADFNEARS